MRNRHFKKTYLQSAELKIAQSIRVLSTLDLLFTDSEFSRVMSTLTKVRDEIRGDLS